MHCLVKNKIKKLYSPTKAPIEKNPEMKMHGEMHDAFLRETLSSAL